MSFGICICICICRYCQLSWRTNQDGGGPAPCPSRSSWCPSATTAFPGMQVPQQKLGSPKDCEIWDFAPTKLFLWSKTNLRIFSDSFLKVLGSFLNVTKHYHIQPGFPSLCDEADHVCDCEPRYKSPHPILTTVTTSVADSLRERRILVDVASQISGWTFSNFVKIGPRLAFGLVRIAWIRFLGEMFLAAMAALYLPLVTQSLQCTEWVSDCNFRIWTQRVTFEP